MIFLLFLKFKQMYMCINTCHHVMSDVVDYQRVKELNIQTLAPLHNPLL